MKLTDKELESPAWAKIQGYLLERKQQLLIQISADMPENQTNKLRGRIHELDALLLLGKLEIEEKSIEYTEF